MRSARERPYHHNNRENPYRDCNQYPRCAWSWVLIAGGPDVSCNIARAIRDGVGAVPQLRHQSLKERRRDRPLEPYHQSGPDLCRGVAARLSELIEGPAFLASDFRNERCRF